MEADEQCVCGHFESEHRQGVGCEHVLDMPGQYFCECEEPVIAECEILFITPDELPCCKKQYVVECGSLDAWLQLRETIHNREAWLVTTFRENATCPNCGHEHQASEFTHQLTLIFIHFDFRVRKWTTAQLRCDVVCNECHSNVGSW